MRERRFNLELEKGERETRIERERWEMGSIRMATESSSVASSLNSCSPVHCHARG